jgi:hypothetical protein
MIERIKDLEYKLVTRESRPEDRERIAQVFSPIPVHRVRKLASLRSCEPIWRQAQALPAFSRSISVCICVCVSISVFALASALPGCRLVLMVVSRDLAHTADMYP